ncbi:MAG: FAD-binding oxidoreductase [Microbacteriaceae bacterium]
MLTNGEVSFWHHKLGGRPELRKPLERSIDRDILIVGGGFTGLWAAYYLKKENPELNIALAEANFCGFGASGRNGGGVGANLSLAKSKDNGSGHHRINQAMEQSVIELVERIEQENIQADLVKVGSMRVAHSNAALKRIQNLEQTEDVLLLSAAEVKAQINIPTARGGVVHKNSYSLNPAKLVRQLASIVENLGVEIYENTAVTSVSNRVAQTETGYSVKANVIVLATEGYTSSIDGFARQRIPMNSSMIATQVIPEEIWEKIGWQNRVSLGEVAHSILYSQHTPDGRIAIGGRGYPYLYGSKTDKNGNTKEGTIRELTNILNRWIPDTKGLEIEHAWSGVLGVPRDWSASVGYDPQTGIAWAGGYVGSGVVVSNLSGRTLRDLILGKKSELVDQIWVNHQSKKWEFEPLRWIGIHTMYKMYNMADDIERKHPDRNKTSKIAKIANLVSGKPY